MEATIAKLLEVPAKAVGVPVAELAAILDRGQSVTYDAGAFLFHESTPRQWFGIVVEIAGSDRDAVGAEEGPGPRDDGARDGDNHHDQQR